MVSLADSPQFFTSTGLSTNLGLINTGEFTHSRSPDHWLIEILSSAKAWGFTIAIILVAFIGKFGGCAVAARYIGFNWREAGAIGGLMSCKGSVWQIL
jgi:Kef-type K+ transport system membrane component KefB